jgi:hypothetical protein
MQLLEINMTETKCMSTEESLNNMKTNEYHSIMRTRDCPNNTLWMDEDSRHITIRVIINQIRTLLKPHLQIPLLFPPQFTGNTECTATLMPKASLDVFYHAFVC